MYVIPVRKDTNLSLKRINNTLNSYYVGTCAIASYCGGTDILEKSLSRCCGRSRTEPSLEYQEVKEYIITYI